MTNCKQCVQTKTSNDGVCYWCDGSCRASDDWQEGCNSSPMNCPQLNIKNKNHILYLFYQLNIK